MSAGMSTTLTQRGTGRPPLLLTIEDGGAADIVVIDRETCPTTPFDWIERGKTPCGRDGVARLIKVIPEQVSPPTGPEPDRFTPNQFM